MKMLCAHMCFHREFVYIGPVNSSTVHILYSDTDYRYAFERGKERVLAFLYLLKRCTLDQMLRFEVFYKFDLRTLTLIKLTNKTATNLIYCASYDPYQERNTLTLEQVALLLFNCFVLRMRRKAEVPLYLVPMQGQAKDPIKADFSLSWTPLLGRPKSEL